MRVGTKGYIRTQREREREIYIYICIHPRLSAQRLEDCGGVEVLFLKLFKSGMTEDLKFELLETVQSSSCKPGQRSLIGRATIRTGT